jgi:drug/metabolite transporter (DMT)-like permease
MFARLSTTGDLPDPVRGVLWMILSSLFYALIYVVVRGLAESFVVNQIVFFRAVLGSAFMLPWLFSAGLGALRTSRMPLYLWRMLFSYIGAVAWMYGIAGMPLADANALMFTMPLFTVILAAIWLTERPGLHRWSATIVGFAGALIILRPGMIEISTAALATLFAAAMFSGALIGSKMLTSTENPNPMVFYLYTLMIPPAAVGAIWGWKTPGLDDIPLLVALGLCTVGAQQCQTRAFRVAPASLVVIVNYIQLPLIALFGWMIFSQSTDIWTWAGAAVICTSTYYVSYREGRNSQRARSQ